MTINEKIYKMRIDLGLSQKEFAEKVGTSQSAINFWENGKRQPRMSQIKKIASALKLPLYALTDDDFEIWDLSNELENNRARFIDPANPTKKPTKRFTTSANNKHTLYVDIDWEHPLTIALKKLENNIRKNYELLNEEGQKEADKQMELANRQIELLTKIPEYRKEPDDTE